MMSIIEDRARQHSSMLATHDHVKDIIIKLLRAKVGNNAVVCAAVSEVVTNKLDMRRAISFEYRKDKQSGEYIVTNVWYSE